MKTKIRNPKIQVILHKVVTRTAAAGNVTSGTGSGAPNSFSTPSVSQPATMTSQSDSTANVIDVTEWLGEGSVVRVQKSVRGDGGVFSIDFVDQPMAPLNDTLASLIEPMDMFEIRFAGDAYKYTGSRAAQHQNGVSPNSSLPIQMRGFVSKVSRNQSMGADGKPRRTVHVEGHDYHKILQIIQVFNMPCTPEAANLITSFPMLYKYGPDCNVLKSTPFLLTVFNDIVNWYISGMQAAGATSGTALTEIACDIQVPDAVMSVQLGAFNAGNVQELLQTYLDIGPFNEMFIEDRDAGTWGPAGPYFVYRPMPLLAAANRQILQPIQDSVTTGVGPASSLYPWANVVSIDASSIISITGARSDANLGNFYWVDAPRFNMNYGDLTLEYANYGAQQGAVPYYLTGYQNVNPLLYGLRKTEVTTQQGGATETNSGNGQPAGEQMYGNQRSFLDWIDDRRNTLIALNQDNVVFEDGDMHLMGNEQIRAGCYVQINYSPWLQSLHYAHTVTHVYEPFGSYLCEVEYDRGTNFIDRITASKGDVSPYYAETLQSGA